MLVDAVQELLRGAGRREGATDLSRCGGWSLWVPRSKSKHTEGLPSHKNSLNEEAKRSRVSKSTQWQKGDAAIDPGQAGPCYSKGYIPRIHLKKPTPLKCGAWSRSFILRALVGGDLLTFTWSRPPI